MSVRSKGARRGLPFLMHILTVLVVAVLGLGAGWLYHGLQPVASGRAAAVTVIVPAGVGSLQVGRTLQEAGVVKNAWAFWLLARVRGQAGQLQAGEYRLDPAAGVGAALQQLVAGQVVRHTVTIPEGFTLAEAAARLGALPGLTPADVTRAVAAVPVPPVLAKPAGSSATPGEGLLFPETYDVTDVAGVQSLAARLVQRTADLWTPEFLARAKAVGLTPWQALTLAAIVEAEAQVPAERPRIAGVYLNRLHQEMKLDADPTVRYALRLPRGVALKPADLQLDSPYNTYKVKGLPPGPICSPGLASVRAVLWPEQTDALYFVAKEDGSGAHYFARTLDEQNANIRKTEPKGR